MNSLAKVIKDAIKPFFSAPIRLKMRALFVKRCVQGKDSHIHSTVQLLGVENIRLGENSFISADSWLNVNHRNADETAIAIGDHCFIGRRNFFSSGKKIQLKDYVLTANDCRFIGSSHNIDNPLIPYVYAGTTSVDCIYVGVNCFFGAGAIVLGNVKIGHGSVIGASAFITKDIPPFSIALGYPAKITKRYSFSRKLWINIEELVEQDLCENPDEDEYLRQLKQNKCVLHMPIIAMGADMGNL